MVRVISGRFKGLKLYSPKGRGTRPTADQVKEAVFSMLVSLPFDFEGARALDFFAGSGALAIEAISRGAALAVAADCDRAALSAIEKNAALLPCSPNLEIMRTRWPTGLERLAGPFNLFFLDPPYENKALPLTLLKEVAARNLAAPGAAAVWEQAPPTLKVWTEADVHPWRLAKTRVWGSQAAALLEYCGR